MRTYNPNQVDEIAFELKNNKAVVLPTDTVWGIVSLKPEAIYKIKNRSKSKKLVLFINDLDFVGLPSDYKKVIEKYWPGSLTIIYKKESYRFPCNKLINQLIDIVGPVFSSSANISGQEPIKSAQEAKQIFAQWTYDLCIVDSESNTSLTSTIVDLDNMKVVREGLISGVEIIDKIQKIKG